MGLVLFTLQSFKGKNCNDQDLHLFCFFSHSKKMEFNIKKNKKKINIYTNDFKDQRIETSLKI